MYVFVYRIPEARQTLEFDRQCTRDDEILDEDTNNMLEELAGQMESACLGVSH